MGHLLGYARVSTTDQHPQLRVDALTAAGCYRVFLAERGVGFRSLQEAIDTTTPGGKLVFHVFAALAEFERDLIRERTSAGLAAGRARGRHGGRPPVMTAHKLQMAQEMYRSRQYTVAAIANTLGVSRASIYRHLTGTDRRVGWPSSRRS
jgi:DNA invertase Pin-like site-specific DNA recombinase